MQPDVCVVVPTLGQRPEMLVASIRSITEQTIPATVVVVAPSVRCAALEPLVLKEGALLLEEQGGGQSAAINQGWAEYGRHCRWLAWLGDDDLLEPGSLESATSALSANPRASMVYGAIRYIDADGRDLFVFRPPIGYGPRLMRYGHNLLSQPGSLLRGTAVDAVGGLDESLRFAMDLDLFLRLSFQGRMVRIHRVLASFRWHPGSLTAGQGEASRTESLVVQERYWSRPRRDRWLSRGARGITQLQYWAAKR